MSGAFPSLGLLRCEPLWMWSEPFHKSTSIRDVKSHNEPFRKYVPAIDGICAYCFGTATYRCSKCKRCCYCSKDHQKRDWKTHKHYCR